VTTAQRTADPALSPGAGKSEPSVREADEAVREQHALLEVRNVSKRFGGIVANRDVSLDVPAGRITGCAPLREIRDCIRPRLRYRGGMRS